MNARVLRDAILAAGFGRAAVDLRGFRSGSLNVLAGVVDDGSEAPSAA
jgi:hypothetical protein